MKTIKEAFVFLEDLKQNNHRDWFQAQKKTYEAYKKFYHETVAYFLLHLREYDARLSDLEVKNCTFRINRDIRFSKDKSPYKTHMGLWFSTQKSRKIPPGYYIHLEEGKSFIAGGLYVPEAEDVKKIRREIAFFHDDLNAILNEKEFKKHFGALDRDEAYTLKKGPKDFEADHPAIELLKLKSFTATSALTVHFHENENWREEIVQKLALLKPLNDFLLRALETEE